MPRLLSYFPLDRDSYLKICGLSFQDVYLIMKQFYNVSSVFQKVIHVSFLMIFI